MKQILLVAALFFTAALSQAQEKNTKSGSTVLSLGADLGIPVGNTTTALFSFVAGGSLQAEFPVASDMGLTLSGGYQSWIKKNGLITLSYIPLLAGVKYHFSPKVYGSAQLGASIAATKNAGTPFTYAPGVGFDVSKNVDILVKYTGLSFKGGGSFNNVGLRLAYSFGK